MIEAERHQEDKIERDGYVLEEQRYSMFTRALPLRDDVDASAISGTYKDGVLEVRIPMPASPSPASHEDPDHEMTVGVRNITAMSPGFPRSGRACRGIRHPPPWC